MTNAEADRVVFEYHDWFEQATVSRAEYRAEDLVAFTKQYARAVRALARGLPEDLARIREADEAVVDLERIAGDQP